MFSSASRFYLGPTSANTWHTTLLFISMVLLWNVPNLLPWEQPLYPNTYLAELLERLSKCLLASALFLTLFSRPWVAWAVSWAIGWWWLPLALAVRWINTSPVSATLVGIGLSSSPAEILELLRSLPLSVPISLLVWNVVCALGLWALRRRGFRDLQWPGRQRAQLAIVCCLLLAAPYFSRWLYPIPDASTPTTPLNSFARASDAFASADQVIGSDEQLPRAFPYELPWAVAQYAKAHAVVARATAEMQARPLTDTLVRDAGAPELLVLVVGESSSRKFWSLYHPQPQPTTPYLKNRQQRGELLAYSNVVAQSVSTRLAVPSMLSAQPLLWPDGKANPQATRSVLSEAAQAGYRTVWLSNQAAIGEFDGAIAAYAHEAQERAFLNPATFRLQGSHDAVLIPALQRQISRNLPTLVVLHTMGSHFRFEHRYPQGFGPYAAPQNTNQSYANSVAYTDAVLEQAIQVLERSQRKAVLLYVSDHGQGLEDAQCKKPLTNRLTVDTYEVPAFLWISSAYAQTQPQILATLQRHLGQPYTTAAVHGTLRDLIAGQPISSSESWLQAPPPGYVQRTVAIGNRWVDFPAAAARNPCLIKAP